MGIVLQLSTVLLQTMFLLTVIRPLRVYVHVHCMQRPIDCDEDNIGTKTFIRGDYSSQKEMSIQCFIVLLCLCLTPDDC